MTSSYLTKEAMIFLRITSGDFLVATENSRVRWEMISSRVSRLVPEKLVLGRFLVFHNCFRRGMIFRGSLLMSCSLNCLESIGSVAGLTLVSCVKKVFISSGLRRGRNPAIAIFAAGIDPVTEG